MKFLLTCLFFIILSTKLQAQVSDFSTISFTKADSVAAQYAGHSLKDVHILTKKLTTPLSTEVEKFRAIYRWVCDNIGYDYQLFKKNKEQRSKLKSSEEIQAWNKKFSASVFKNLRDKRRTVCGGYAYLIREMCLHAGLQCVIIDGYGRTAEANIRGTGSINHSWNAISLNDKWYLADATWSSGAYDTKASQYLKRYENAYFLCDPNLFIRNHFPKDSTWMLLTVKPTLQSF